MVPGICEKPRLVFQLPGWPATQSPGGLTIQSILRWRIHKGQSVEIKVEQAIERQEFSWWSQSREVMSSGGRPPCTATPRAGSSYIYTKAGSEARATGIVIKYRVRTPWARLW
jgi:hypothetical protein